MIKPDATNFAAEVRSLPPSMLDASLLADYVKTGEAYDLWPLCKKSYVPIKQVAQIVVAGGLDDVDKLPGYAMMTDIFELADNLYSFGETRRPWHLIRNRHKPAYLEGHLPRQELKRIESDTAVSRRHYADVFFRAWAVFWDDNFIDRMIGKIDGRIISSLPPELITEKNCFNAVADSGLALRYVPESLRSLAVCIRAVQNNAAALAFVPADLRAKVRKLHTQEFD